MSKSSRSSSGGHTAIMDEPAASAPPETSESSLLSPDEPLVSLPGEGRLTGPAPLVTPPAGFGSLADPNAVLGTRFAGPLMSGPIGPGLGVPGICALHKRGYFTAATGNFNLPIVFPSSAILLVMYTQIQQSFNGTTPTLALNNDQAGTSHAVGPIDLTVAPTQLAQNITGILGSSWTMYLNFAGGGATLGKCTVIIEYSVPAKVVFQ